jgi:hypothetical protein
MRERIEDILEKKNKPSTKGGKEQMVMGREKRGRGMEMDCRVKIWLFAPRREV